MIDIEWEFGPNGTVTALFGRCRITQYLHAGGMICTLPALPTEDETKARLALFERKERTGKIWVEGEEG